MLSGRPLFPGRDCKLDSSFSTIPWRWTYFLSRVQLDHHQLTLILDVLGTPSQEDFAVISSRRSRDYLRALPTHKAREFSSIYPNASPLALDFLKKTLTFSPKNRLTVEECLAHPYLANYHG